MNNTHTQHDEAIRQALEHLPEAPTDPTFASRVMARAAVTPQGNAASALAARATDLRPALKFAWAMAGFSFGVAIFLSIYINLLTDEMSSAINAAPRPSVTQSVLVFDPLESALAEQWSLSGADRQ